MIIGRGFKTKILWFFSAVVESNASGDKLVFTFRINDSTQLVVLSFEPKQPHEIWVKENLYQSAVEDFMADVFNKHFMADDIDITKYPQAYGVCVRVKRALVRKAEENHS